MEKAWDKDKYKYLKNLEFRSTDINSPMAYETPPETWGLPLYQFLPPIEWFSIDLRQLTESTMTIKILRIDQVTEQTGLSRSSVYKQIRLGRFPRAIKLTTRASGWEEGAVQGWIEDRLKAQVSDNECHEEGQS